MYLNPKTIKELESMCFNKYQICDQYRPRYNDFLLIPHLRKDKENYKKYDLFKIENQNQLKECLGIEFSNMNLSNFKFNVMPSHKVENFFDRNRMPSMMHSYKNFIGMKAEPNDFESKVIEIHESIQIISNSVYEIFNLVEQLNYEPLINEWKSFAKYHNIDIEIKLKEITDIIEKNNIDNKELLTLKNDYNKLEKVTMDFLLHYHNLLKKFYHNDSFMSKIFNKNDKYSTRDELLKKIVKTFEDEIEAEGLNQKKNMIVQMINEFNYKLTTLNKTNNQVNNFDINTIEKNNEILLDSLANVYLIMKDKIDIQLNNFRFRNMAIDFLNQLDKTAQNEENIKECLEKNKKHTMLVVENFAFEGIKYKKLALFLDQSCAALVEGNEKFEYFINVKSMSKIVKNAMITYLKNTVRKNPTIAKVMSLQFDQRVEKETRVNRDIYHNNRLHYDKLILCINTYFKNENILKSEKFNFITEIEKSTAYEKLDDKMNKIIREHNIRKYAESIVSNKYKHLYSAQSYKLFKELYNLKIDKKIIQEMLGKKLAAVESKSMFNEQIKNLINSFNDFNMDAFKIKAESVKATVISDTDNILILEISDYTQCKKLGSGSWCITRNKTYFDQYTEQGAKQYFIYDFNQSSKNTKSLIGITLLKTLKVKAAHTKSDARLNDNKIVEYLTSKVKEVQEAKKSKRTLTVVDSKKSKQSSNTKITNVNDINPNGMIIGF